MLFTSLTVVAIEAAVTVTVAVAEAEAVAMAVAVAVADVQTLLDRWSAVSTSSGEEARSSRKISST
jgi:hypothetical protein